MNPKRFPFAPGVVTRSRRTTRQQPPHAIARWAQRFLLAVGLLGFAVGMGAMLYLAVQLIGAGLFQFQLWPEAGLL